MFKIMTFNIRYSTTKDGDNHWAHTLAEFMCLILPEYRMFSYVQPVGSTKGFQQQGDCI
jgi:hypothetical protein